MSEAQLLPGNPFDIDRGELPNDQLSAKLLAEQLTAAAVLPFEAEKQFVNRDHNNLQKHLWGESADHKYPVELPADGA